MDGYVAFRNAPPSDLHQPFFRCGPICGAVSCQTEDNVPRDSGTNLAHLVQKLHTTFWNVPKIRAQGVNCVGVAKGSEASCTWGRQYIRNT